MKGQRIAQEPLFACVRLEDMVPRDHILRRIERAIDFSFIDRRTEAVSAGGLTGRGVAA